MFTYPYYLVQVLCHVCYCKSNKCIWYIIIELKYSQPWPSYWINTPMSETLTDIDCNNKLLDCHDHLIILIFYDLIFL
jgi:hypothetical protein